MYIGSSLEVFFVVVSIIILFFIESYLIDEKNEIYCLFY